MVLFLFAFGFFPQIVFHISEKQRKERKGTSYNIALVLTASFFLKNVLKELSF